jgi:hypothetical protein
MFVPVDSRPKPNGSDIDWWSFNLLPLYFQFFFSSGKTSLGHFKLSRLVLPFEYQTGNRITGQKYVWFSNVFDILMSGFQMVTVVLFYSW